jgi:hypothetical protein
MILEVIMYLYLIQLIFLLLIRLKSGNQQSSAHWKTDQQQIKSSCANTTLLHLQPLADLY